MLRERAYLLGCGLGLLDTTMIALGYRFSFILRPSDVPPRLLARLIFLALLAGVLLALRWLGGYQSLRQTSLGTELRLVVQAFCCAGALLPVILWVQPAAVQPAIFLAAAFACLCLGRLGLRIALRALRRRGHNQRQYLIGGSGARAREIAREVAAQSWWGIQVLGHLSVPGYGSAAGDVIGKLDDLDEILETRVVDGIFLSAEELSASALRQALACCRRFGIQAFVDLHPLAELCGTLRVSRLAKSPLLVIAHTRIGEGHERLKRAFDFLLAAAGLVALSPVLLGIAILIKLSSPGPVLFRQLRVGVNGRSFTMFKFRSMVVDAERLYAAIACHNEMSGPVFKMRADPRISGIGRFLRGWSLDELPQLWNVLRGDMSLVGPRPPLPREVGQYESWQRRRLSVRPGLTCLWQVSGRNQIDFDDWMKLDLEYIDHWSWWLDLKILCRTLPAMLRGQ